MEARTTNIILLIFIFFFFVSMGLLLDSFRRDVVIIAICFALCAASFDYASGFGGLQSLGPIIPFGIGAYLHGYLIREGLVFFISLPIVLLFSSFVGLICYWIVVRHKDENSSWLVFGLISSLALEQIARLNTDLLGGSNGLIIPRYFNNVFFAEKEGYVFFGLTILILLVCLVCLGRSVYSSKGARILFMKYEPERLRNIGISPSFLRMKIISLQWAISGVSGAIYVSTVGVIDPSVFGLNNNLTILVAAVAFGEKTILRPAIIAFSMVTFENIAGSAFAGYQTLLLGISLILVLYFYKEKDLKSQSPIFSIGTYGVRFW